MPRILTPRMWECLTAASVTQAVARVLKEQKERNELLLARTWCTFLVRRSRRRRRRPAGQACDDGLDAKKDGTMCDRYSDTAAFRGLGLVIGNEFCEGVLDDARRCNN